MLSPTEVLFLQDESRKVHVEEALVDYIISLVNQTRRHAEIELGVSPRGTAALFRAAQSLAMLDGRSFVIPDDIKKLVRPVFEHRLAMMRSGTRTHREAKTVLQEIIDHTACTRIRRVMWNNFMTAIGLLAIALLSALYSSSAGRDGRVAAAAISGFLALGIAILVGIRLVPRLASNVDWEWLPFFSRYHVTREGWIYFGAIVVVFAAINTGE